MAVRNGYSKDHAKTGVTRGRNGIWVFVRRCPALPRKAGRAPGRITKQVPHKHPAHVFEGSPRRPHGG